MIAALFVGPSVPAEEVARWFGGEVLPPVGRGDIDALLRRSERPDRIGIVDGAFLQRLAISPKEVLRAVDAGVRVYGSSSMGALRAVECAPWGVIGVGRIFGLFADGVLEADDEVAIAYDPDSGRALAEPLVNIRIVLEAAARAGSITRGTADVALAAARARYFPERSYRRLLSDLAEVLPADEHRALTAVVQSPDRIDQKRLDALELIDRLQTDP